MCSSDLDDPDLGPIRMQGNPIKLSVYDDPATRGAAPDLDYDRKAILAELGIPDDLTGQYGHPDPRGDMDISHEDDR